MDINDNEKLPASDDIKLDVVGRQYQVYVEMAEALIDRRAEANRFYLTINTALIGAIGFVFQNDRTIGQDSTPTLLTAAAIFGIMVCYLWARILASHRRLLGAKFKVIHQLEAMLPTEPYLRELERDEEDRIRRVGVSTYESLLPNLLLVAYLVGATFGVASTLACVDWRQSELTPLIWLTEEWPFDCPSASAAASTGDAPADRQTDRF